MYKAVIGLEIHCELKTNSKNFSLAKNSYEDQVNVNIDPTCIGLPGILPVVNKEAVRKSLKVALALNCKVPETLTFERKNYFYPDLPKGYQITQFKNPIGTKGYLMVNVDGKDLKVDITDTHLEEDTANLDHYSTYSLINYNRAGVPLLETVTEPCMHTAEEALAFLEALRSMFLYLDVSDTRADRGQIRCDVNISLMKEDSKEFGTRVEIKNVNSFGNVYSAIKSEIKRQENILNSGGVIEQETRRYVEAEDKTVTMRSKEDAIDYKYFTEPNIPPITISKELVEEVKKEIPVLQFERYKTYIDEYKLSLKDTSTIIKEKAISDFFDECVSIGIKPIQASNFLVTNILTLTNKLNVKINELFLKPDMLKEIVDLLEQNKISSKQAKELLVLTVEKVTRPTELVKQLGMEQVTDTESIRNIVKEVLSEQPDAIITYKSGRERILDFLVGQVMKKSRGQANPGMASTLLIEEINKI